MSAEAYAPKVGDVVQLVSGGPRMTVESVSEKVVDEPGRRTVSCVWFYPTLNVGSLTSAKRDGEQLAWDGPHRGTFSPCALRELQA